jgi:hypothetical protein
MPEVECSLQATFLMQLHEVEQESIRTPAHPFEYISRSQFRVLWNPLMKVRFHILNQANLAHNCSR